MSSRLVVVFLLLLLVSFKQQLRAQGCDETLTQAVNEFEAGHLYGIPSLLKGCIDNGFNKTQRIQAYRLLTRTYLLIDDPISAEDSYLKLLSLDPEYNIDEEVDPVDLVYMDEKFTTTPIFILFTKLGLNVTNANPTTNYGVDNDNLSLEKYTSGIGFHFGVGTELNINNSFSIGVELLASTVKYKYSNTLFGGDEQTLTENILQASVPVYLKYRKKYDKWMPFVYGGIAPELTLRANAQLELVDQANFGNENSSVFPVTGPDILLTDQREKINYSGFLGIGTNYRIGYNYVFFDLRYELGLTNIVNNDERFNNQELIYRYGYVDDSKNLNKVMISFGFVKPLYKPRKVSEKKQLFKGLFKKKSKAQDSEN